MTAHGACIWFQRFASAHASTHPAHSDSSLRPTLCEYAAINEDRCGHGLPRATDIPRQYLGTDAAQHCESIADLHESKREDED